MESNSTTSGSTPAVTELNSKDYANLTTTHNTPIEPKVRSRKSVSKRQTEVNPKKLLEKQSQSTTQDQDALEKATRSKSGKKRKVGSSQTPTRTKRLKKSKISASVDLQTEPSSLGTSVGTTLVEQTIQNAFVSESSMALQIEPVQVQPTKLPTLQEIACKEDGPSEKKSKKNDNTKRKRKHEDKKDNKEKQNRAKQQRKVINRRQCNDTNNELQTQQLKQPQLPQTQTQQPQTQQPQPQTQPQTQQPQTQQPQPQIQSQEQSTPNGEDFFRSRYKSSTLQQCTIPELKIFLRQKHLPVGGKKLDLITRIEAYFVKE